MRKRERERKREKASERQRGEKEERERDRKENDTPFFRRPWWDDAIELTHPRSHLTFKLCLDNSLA